LLRDQSFAQVLEESGGIIPISLVN